jgi:hypothetical protein
MTAGGRLLAIGAAMIALGACRSGQSLPELKGGIEIGLRRGAAWSTYTVKPPYIIGNRGSLRINRGRMTGSVGGRQLSVAIEPDGLSGRAGGTVEVEIHGTRDDVEVSGVWNGERVHFTITPDVLSGTIVAVSGEGHCQYVLDRVSPEGTRLGMSTCSGLPEETAIEIPRAISGWLTQNEMVGVLLALLSTPPLTSLEPGPGGR